MASIYREWRTVAASVFSLLLIVGAYYMARGFDQPNLAEAASQAELLQTIATKDSDGDGLPDWEESLYGTDPHKPDSKNLGMSDGEAVARGLIVPAAQGPATSAVATGSGTYSADGVGPATANSLTDVFAKNFFTLYVAAKQQKGSSLTAADINSLALQAIAQLSTSITPAPDFKTARELNVVAGGNDALIAYAANAARVFAAHGAHLPKSELLYLEDAANQTPGAIGHIQEIALSYHDIAVGLAALPVPRELASAHLSLINALARVSAISGDFAKLGTDPVVTMLALEQYPKAVLALSKAFQDEGSVYRSTNTVPLPGSDSANFLQAIAGLAKPTTP